MSSTELKGGAGGGGGGGNASILLNEQQALAPTQTDTVLTQSQSSERKGVFACVCRREAKGSDRLSK